jgi:hypothetical protein
MACYVLTGIIRTYNRLAEAQKTVITDEVAHLEARGAAPNHCQQGLEWQCMEPMPQSRNQTFEVMVGTFNVWL